MKLKYYLSCFLVTVLLLTGCGRSFDGSGYVTSILDVLCKGDYTAYMDFTGVSRSDVSLYRDQWLSVSTNAFLTAFGSGTPSEETTERITSLLTQLYANTRYETAADSSDQETIHITIQPLNILIDNDEAIRTYVHSFNEKNTAFSYADLTEEAYYDTYLDGILTILESHLADLSFGDDVVIDAALEKNEDGLYSISDETLTAIQNALIPWPADTDSTSSDDQASDETAETAQNE